MTVAYWCVLAAGLMPWLFTVIAKAGARGFSNRAPRVFLDRLQGWRKRADWAQQNSFEAFPLFAAAVIIAHQVGAEQARVDMLALSFVVLRLLYGAAYIADKAALRSLIWFAALLTVVALFVEAA